MKEGHVGRNIGSVGHKEAGGRIGGQERTHSVEEVRNGQIGGRHGAETDGQRVLKVLNMNL